MVTKSTIWVRLPAKNARNSQNCAPLSKLYRLSTPMSVEPACPTMYIMAISISTEPSSV